MSDDVAKVSAVILDTVGRDDVPAWMRIAGDAGWLRDLIRTLKKDPWMTEYVLNLERLVADVDELADELFETTLKSLIDSGQIRRLPNAKLFPGDGAHE